jgi:hypothetical protein
MKNDGGPAFPPSLNVSSQGMTLRDYFAAKAIPLAYRFWMHDFYGPDMPDADVRGEVVRNDWDEELMEMMACDCYKMADAMLKAREE